ncbi:MAG: hypothetical protein IPM34_10695 [Saprospiraceae bacterium]|nr:hypothetical protein [Saprospiraceae bacterium]
MEPTRTILSDAYRQPEASANLNEQTNWLSHFRKNLSWIKPTIPLHEEETPGELLPE